ncbi:MAG: aldehyde dehydrogenase [Burkholderiaceae bacterium]|nr:aldehyde dehydrogenase [Burkholderiaceae bacterium]
MVAAYAYTQDKLFIGGEWVAPLDGEVVPSIDPSTGAHWALAAFGGKRDVDRAVEAAGAAMRGPWGRMPVAERAALMRKLGGLLEANAERIAELETRDNGRPLRETRLNITAEAQWYYYFAGLADKLDGRMMQINPALIAYTTRVPVGVVGAIVPWNAPTLVTTMKLAPALAAGCAMVIKVAEHTPVTTYELARLVEQAGFPKGVVNVVPGWGHVAGAHLAGHPGVDKLSFTGEHRTAQEIMRAGAANLKRVSFECGGKSPHIVFEDADLEQAANAVAHAGFMACGQSCALGSRILVARPLYAKLVDEVGARAAKLRVGNPLEATTHIGPQTHKDQLEKTLRYIDIGKSEGARLVAGGVRLTDAGRDKGYFVSPTVFADVKPEMRIAQEEIFGPVVSMIPFDSEEHALEIANGVNYGLTAGLWTRDLGRAHRFSSQLRAGTVWVNTYRIIHPAVPYGGFKISGIGRENGPEAIDEYTEPRATMINLEGKYPYPYA